MAGPMSEETAGERGVATGAPETVSGVPLRIFSFDIAGRRWDIRAARDHASLMAAADSFVAFPFGLLLWESAQALAEALAEGADAITGRTVLELGAGVGFPGIVARGMGAARVRQTDHISEALELCRINARANGIDGVEVGLANWDAWTDAEAYEVIIGSDVIYERQAHAPLAAILERNLKPGGRAFLADPGRQDTPLFLADLGAKGWKSRQQRRTLRTLLPGGAETVGIDIIELWR
jgi:predicted nicotinamide N-methyase